METYCVYKHTSPSGKYYIGITRRDVNKRWRDGKNYLRVNSQGEYMHKAFAAAILKYGWDHFRHEVLITGLGEQTAKNIERDFIAFAKKANLSYNLTDGGDGCKGLECTQVTRERLRLASTGRRHSDAAKQLMRERALGRKMSEETKQKISASLLNNPNRHLGHPQSSSTRLQIAEKKRGRPVTQLDLEGNYIQTFPCAKDAARYFGASKDNGCIKKCCLGLMEKAYGYKWRY